MGLQWQICLRKQGLDDSGCAIQTGLRLVMWLGMSLACVTLVLQRCE